MKIEFTWNRPDGSKPFVGFAINPNDPHRDDEEMQFDKAVGGAQAYFYKELGEAPPLNQLTCHIIRE